MITDANSDRHPAVKDCLDYTLFSWTRQSGLEPIDARRAEGVYIYDRDEKRYLDFSSQLMNVNIGHGHPAVKAAVVKQMDELCYVYPGMATEVRAKLGKKLAEITPGNLKRTFFTLGGADAVENAIKLARSVTGRSKIVSLYRSYHGSTYGAMSAGGDPRRFGMDDHEMLDRMKSNKCGILAMHERIKCMVSAATAMMMNDVPPRMRPTPFGGNS